MSQYTKTATMDVVLCKTKCDGCGTDECSDAEALHSQLRGGYIPGMREREFSCIFIRNPNHKPEGLEAGGVGQLAAAPQLNATCTEMDMHAALAREQENPYHVRRDFCTACAQGRFL